MHTATSIFHPRVRPEAPPAQRRLAILAVLVLALLGSGCVHPTASLRAAPLFDRSEALARASADNEATTVSLSGAGGEWLDFTVDCSGSASRLRLAPLRFAPDQPTDSAEIPPQVAQYRVYRVEEMPADLNRAAIHRFYGGDAVGTARTFPTALVPLAKDPEGAARIAPGGTGAARLWIDIEVPRSLPRGEWQTRLEALDEDDGVLASLPMTLQSHGFDLPAARSLTISSTAPWEQLQEMYGVSRAAKPELLSRDPEMARNVADVQRLDALQRLAQAHRLQVEFPELTVPVKWPAGRDPRIDWSGYDEVIAPWMSGSAFADGVGLADWPLPTMRGIERYNPASRRDYWQRVLSHFDDRGWLEQSTLWLIGEAISAAVDRMPEAVRRDAGYSPSERAQVAAEAARLTNSYPAGRIALPLDGDHVRFRGPENPGFIEPEAAGRLMIRADGLLADEHDRPWPAGLEEPGRWLAIGEASGVKLPSPGASEADVRLWAWLAFLRNATHLRAGSALPAPAPPGRTPDPTQIAWFYPADWFGGEAGDAPIPSVQLKWLRRAQQDYEYMAAAAERMEGSYARVVARALVRPVRVGAHDAVDPLQALWAGTPQAQRWDEGVLLVAEKVAASDDELRPQLPPRFVADHTNRTTRWLADRERPLPAITGARWDLAGEGEEERLYLRLRTDIYNPSDVAPEGMTLSWVTLPGGETPDPPRDTARLWRVPSVGAGISAIETYEVGTSTLNASASVETLAAHHFLALGAPATVAVRDDFTGVVSTTEAILPAVAVTRRGEVPSIDGRLGEWSGNEAILDGPLVRMADRPSMQAGQVSRTAHSGQGFVGWTGQGLHIAFRFDGIETGTAMQSSRNFVDLQDRRTWGEDVCELLLQPVWSVAGDPTDGPLLHIVAKPHGAFVRRARDRRTQAQVWQAFESDLRYAATVDDSGVWRAELTLPWSALRSDGVTLETFNQRPTMLRFNLNHHDSSSGQSGSWAGPVDYPRDPALTGAILLRDPD